MLVCASAAGQYTKPMIIYPATQFKGLIMKELFEECYITKSKNGWIYQTLFRDFMETVFITQTAHLQKPVLLLVDGHVSHQSVEVSRLCQEHGIILYCLLAHTSHILQPLNDGIFRNMKNEWRKSVKEFTNTLMVVTKRNFGIVFKQPCERTVEKALCAMTFRKAGIFPPLLDSVDK